MMLKTSLLLFGLTMAAINCYGAFEQGLLMEKGQISYLTLATPLVALGSLFIPYFAERAWEQGHHLKAVIWVFILAPTVATVFYVSAERIHNAKAGMRAEHSAQNIAVARAEKTLNELKEARDRAEKAATEGRKQARTKCPDACLQRLDAAFDQMNERVSNQESRVRDIQAAAVSDSPWSMPTWLMPVAIDLIAFMCIWTGLALPTSTASVAVRRRKPTIKKSRAPPKQPVSPILLRAVP